MLFALLFIGLATLYCGAATAPASASSGAAATSAQSPPINPGLRLPYPTDVLTYHNNVYRQGMTSQETTLTTSNVNSTTFGKIAFDTVDGKVDAQPLYVNEQFIGGNLNNVLYVVTENDSIYAFDANSGRQYWKSSALGQGETPSDDHGCRQITPQI